MLLLFSVGGADEVEVVEVVLLLLLFPSEGALLAAALGGALLAAALGGALLADALGALLPDELLWLPPRKKYNISIADLVTATIQATVTATRRVTATDGNVHTSANVF